MAEIVRSIQFPTAIDRQRGTYAEERDHAAHVEQMILQVLFTTPGERAMRPDFGCGLRDMVFAPNSEVTANLLQVTVQAALDQWLGGVIRTDDVAVRAVEERLEVRITYLLRARMERRILNLEVTP